MPNRNTFLHIIPRKTAKELGLKRYFTGKPCGRGHITERNKTDGNCLECKRMHFNNWNKSEKGKAYAKSNLAKHRAVSKKYTENNPDKRKTSSKAYFENNKDYYISRKHKYRAQSELATPSWENRRKTLDIINNARTNGKHVDHIVPLNSSFVCGLNWHGNLQLLDGAENSRKGNRYWPNMPNTKDPELLKMVEEFKQNELV